MTTMNAKTTIAIGNIATKIIAAAQMDDAEMVEAFRVEIVKACESELKGFAPGGVPAVVAATRAPAAAGKKTTGGLNGYGRFSSKKRAELDETMGPEAAKAYFKEQGGVNTYIPQLWAALTPVEQATWNAEAKEIRDAGPAATEGAGPAAKTNQWHPFQKAYPAYLAAEGLAIPFTGLATATGEKYQELKKIPGAVAKFIADYPPLPKVKNAKAKAGAAVSPVAI